ncbi:YadA-like family protein [Paraburkholderia sediminicola]
MTAGNLSASSTDAVNGSQLYATNQNVANIGNTVNNITNGGGIKYFHTNSTLADASATGTNATAIGPLAVATGSNSIAMGNGATANKGSDIAIGQGSSATGTSTQAGAALGWKAVADNGGTAIGSQASATGANNSVAIGNTAVASAANSMALGVAANASAANSVALGAYSTTTANLSAAGYNPGTAALSGTASAANGEVSVGSAGKERRVTNVAAGSAATDAVNVSQLQSEDAKVNTINNNVNNLSNNVTNISNTVNNITNGGGIKYFHANSTGADSTASGSNSIAIGQAATSVGTAAIAVGVNATTSGNNSTSIGGDSKAGDHSVSIGNGADTSGADYGVAVGVNSSANGLWATAMGASAKASGDKSVSIGTNSTASGSQSAALGLGATASATNSVALGSGSTTKANLSAAGYNPGSLALSGTASATNGEVSVGAAGAERRVTNVAAGSAATDAVNVSQLMSEDAKVNQNTSDITNLNTQITTINGQMAGAVVYDSSAHDVVTLGGKKGTKITNLTAGDVSATSTDAVNGSQLYATNQNVSNLAGNVTNISNTVNNITNGGTGIKYFHANSTLADSSATGIDSLAAGPAAVASATDAVALGNGANASNAGAVALGAGSKTTAAVATTGTTIGGITYKFAGTAPSSTVSVGAAGSERTITNVAAGRLSATSTDAVNGSELFATNQQVTQNSTDITNLTNSITNGGVGLVQQDAASRNITVAKDTDGTVVDFTGTKGARKLTGVSAGDVNATSVDAVNGSQLYALASSTADALGGGSTVNNDGTITNPTYVVDGTTVNNVGDAITNIDGRVTENTTDITSINSTLNNITNGSMGVKYFHANSTLADSQATGAESVAIGGNAQSLAANSVALGSNSVADRANTVSVGAAGAERQITNVAAGTADTDAVNVAQLRASGIINPNGTTNAAVTYDHNTDGSTNYNSVTMGNGVDGGTTIHNVAAGTAGDDAVNVNQMNAAISTVTNIAAAANNPMFAADGSRDTEAAVASGTHSTAMGANASASAANSVALGANSVADRANTVSVGSAGNERQVTNVAAGTATTDAVNVGQLNDSIGAAVGNLPAGMTAKNYTDQQINSVQNGVNAVAKNAYSGIAAATALTMIPDVDQGKTIAVGIGGGSYKGSQAVALGVSARITENLKMKAGTGTSSGGTTVGLGASYQW